MPAGDPSRYGDSGTTGWKLENLALGWGIRVVE
jgi:hypothetical protein